MLEEQIRKLEEEIHRFRARNSQSNPGAAMELRAMMKELKELKEQKEGLAKQALRVALGLTKTG